MRVRNGFVSNSSSSSFVIVGCFVSDDLAEEIEQRLESRLHFCSYEYNKYHNICGFGYTFDEYSLKELSKAEIDELFELASEVSSISGKGCKLICGVLRDM